MAATVLAVALIAGGHGVNEVAKKGATGDWDIRGRSGAFNTQACCTLVGTVLVIGSVVLALSVGQLNTNESASAASAAAVRISNALTHESVATLHLERVLLDERTPRR